jgi:small-conductance mechanosensitive channel
MSLTESAPPTDLSGVLSSSIPSPLPSSAPPATVITGLRDTLQQMLNLSSTSAEFVVSILIFIGLGVISWVSYVLIKKYVTKWTEKTAMTFAPKMLAIIKTVVLVLVGIIVIRFSLSPLTFFDPYRSILDKIFLVVQVLLVAYAISKIINIIIDWVADKLATQKKEKNKKHQMFILKRVATGIVFGVALILIALNLLEITEVWQASFASLGIGAIVAGFVLQSAFSDFFSSLYIYLDHPFEIGDLIFVGEYGGTVKNIGILTTRLQLLQGEELVISNKELNSQYVRNFKKLQKRRIIFNIGVTYDTPNEKLTKIPLIITDIIKNVKGATPQFVNFNEFGEYSLKFFISYFVNSSEYKKYLEVQQEINLAIREVFEREGIELAYLKNVGFIKR